MNKHSILHILWLSLAWVPQWGFFSHKLINEQAVYTLPPELASFFKHHLYQITENAIQPDRRVYIDSAEAVRHYIDLDRVEDNLDSLVIPWYKVKLRQNQQQLRASGIVPWQVDITYRKLCWAFKEKKVGAILRHATDLGHYLSDAHVPLHTSSNYNGQFSNQIGIHALWETRIPERFWKTYNLLVGPAEYIDHVLEFAWQTVRDSHQLLDAVFSLEKLTASQVPSLLHKSYIPRGNQMIHSFSNRYVDHYHALLAGMVERRLRASIKSLGSLWLSAWIDAGQPDLPVHESENQTIEEIDVSKKKAIGRSENLEP